MNVLLDSNVLVAASVAGHPHRQLALQVVERDIHFLISAHSLVELFSTLTKSGGYAWLPQRAWSVVHEVRNQFTVRHLTSDQQFDAVGHFAKLGGVGARVHDYLIGYVAVVHALDMIVTLNDRDFRPLFPDLTILTPAQYLETL